MFCLFLFIISIVYRWGGIETSFFYFFSLCLVCISIVYRWGGIETEDFLCHNFIVIWNFYCLPLRRYWDIIIIIAANIKNISIVYRWGGIETRNYIRLRWLIRISIVYRWGGIETKSLLWKTFSFFCVISIVYRWGGIETQIWRTRAASVSRFLLSTAEAVLRLCHNYRVFTCY